MKKTTLRKYSWPSWLKDEELEDVKRICYNFLEDGKAIKADGRKMAWEIKRALDGVSTVHAFHQELRKRMELHRGKFLETTILGYYLEHHG